MTKWILILQVEPRKMSVYREEAIDVLISCLKNSNFPHSQITAAETIVSLQGQFSYSGKSRARTFLLKRAGLDKRYANLKRAEQLCQVLSKSEENLVCYLRNFLIYMFLANSFQSNVVVVIDEYRKKKRRLRNGKEKWRLF